MPSTLEKLRMSFLERPSVLLHWKLVLSFLSSICDKYTKLYPMPALIGASQPPNWHTDVHFCLPIPQHSFPCCPLYVHLIAPLSFFSSKLLLFSHFFSHAQPTLLWTCFLHNFFMVLFLIFLSK